MLQEISNQIQWSFEPYQTLIPKILIAIAILIAGAILAYILYFIIRSIIQKTRIQYYLQRFSQGDTNLWSQDIGTVIAKSVAVFLFIIVLRKVVMFLGFYEVENFLSDVINYLPNLFIAILIGFFGIRFSRTVYSVVRQTSRFSDERTANVLANMSKAIILFFTFMIVLHYIKIVDEFIINSVLVGFIGMLALAGGIAFGLGGRWFAEEILWNFKEGVEPIVEAKANSRK